ncbi:MAG: trigger factor [Chloroflexi bacterium]|nr:trigger factor [Chloroflexota bacterium]
MKVTTERQADCNAVITVEVDEEQIERAMRSAASRVSRIRPIPGFRPGKAPYARVERIVGKELLRDEAIDELAQSLYKQVLQDEKIDPYDTGKLDIAQKDPLVLKFTVPTRPVVTLGDYRTLHLTPQTLQVTDVEVNETLERIRRENAEMTPVTRPVQLNDLATLNINGGLEGGATLDREGLPVEILKEGGVFPWLEQLVGANAGETRTIMHTFTGDEPKTATYTVTVVDVKEPHLPELNDDFAKSVSQFENMEQLTTAIRSQLYAEKERKENERFADEAVDAVVAQATIAFPASMLDDEIGLELERSKSLAQQLGLTWDKYLELAGKKEEEIREEAKPRAARRVNRLLTLMQVAEMEKIEATRKDVDMEIDLRAMYAQQNGGNAAQTRRALSNAESRRDIEFQLKLSKSVAFIASLLKGDPTSGKILTPEMVREEERRAREQAAAQPGAPTPGLIIPGQNQ